MDATVLSRPFSFRGVMLNPADLRYNPCDDLIFPSVLRAADVFARPLGLYYMYYAPHNAPGGLCLAYADALEGPWQEYHANPLVTNDWKPHYNVNHVSSPDAVWDEENGVLLLYYHGENTTTRFATSVDGIHFEYGGVAVTNDQVLNRGGREASYARVFRHTPAGTDSRYIMLFFASDQGHHNIYLAQSQDGRHWDVRYEPLLYPPAGTTDICAPWFFTWGDQYYVVCHGGRRRVIEGVARPLDDLHLFQVDAGLNSGDYAGRLLERTAVDAENERVSDPCIIQEGDTAYLFCSIGPRLQQKLALFTTTWPAA